MFFFSYFYVFVIFFFCARSRSAFRGQKKMYIASKSTEYKATVYEFIATAATPAAAPLLPCPHHPAAAAPIATALLPMPLSLRCAAAAATTTTAVAAAAPHVVAADAAAALHGRLWTWTVVGHCHCRCRHWSLSVVVDGCRCRCRWSSMVVVVIVGGRCWWSLLSLPLSSLSPSVVGRSWSVIVVSHGHDYNHHATSWALHVAAATCHVSYQYS